MRSSGDLVTAYLRWIWARAVLHHGWWLLTAVYFVVESGLSAAQLVLIGVAQGAVALLFEVPAGVVADTVGRRASLLVSHALMGTAMLTTALVTEFWPLVVTQMLWGISWTFASGADVAWITDELDDPTRTSAVLMRSGQAELAGAATGLVVLGAAGSLLPRATVMAIAGGAMLVLGLYVAVRFGERRFVPTTHRRCAGSWRILRDGIALVRSSRAIVVMLAATFLVNGAHNSARLFPLRLVELGFPTEPVLWFTGLGVLTLLVGAIALRLVERRVDTARGMLRWYALACVAGAVGFIALAVVPEELSGSAAVVLVSGVAAPMARVIGTIWVNRHSTQDVRATVHSFLAQSEYLGEMVCGLGVAAVAGSAGLHVALLLSAALLAITVALMPRAGPRP